MGQDVRQDVANGMNFGRRIIDHEINVESTESDTSSTKQEAEQVVQLNVKVYEDFGSRWYEDRKRYIQVCASPGMMLRSPQHAFLISQGMWSFLSDDSRLTRLENLSRARVLALKCHSGLALLIAFGLPRIG
jgi:hypothetical protein